MSSETRAIATEEQVAGFFGGRLAPETVREIVRFLRYLVIGITTGIVDFATLGLIILVFEPQSDLSVLLANTTAISFGCVAAFLLHSRITFQRRVPLLSRWFAFFILINIGSLIISNISVLFFRWAIEQFVGLEGGLAILAAKVPTAAILAAYNYLAFRRLFLSEEQVVYRGP
jgi:putative flippase GtrA